MKFTKTLLAAAVLAAASGSANANISIGDLNADALFQLYDGANKSTYSLDLGSKTAIANIIAGANASITWDLTSATDAPLLSSFLATISNETSTNQAKVKWGVLAGFGNDALFTSTKTNTPTNLGLLTPADYSSLGNVTGVMQIQASQFNAGLASSAAKSSVISDGSTGGNFNQNSAAYSTLFGTFSAASAAIAIPAFTATAGKAANFFLSSADNSGNFAAALAGTFNLNLSTHTLTYTNAIQPAAIPLPAAVWMFGAGIMGMLGLNRRKSAAV